MASLLAAVRWLGEAVSSVFNYFAGERLRRLGRLEVEQMQKEAEDEANRIAAEVDAIPDVTDPVLLRRWLLNPSDRPPV